MITVKNIQSTCLMWTMATLFLWSKKNKSQEASPFPSGDHRIQVPKVLQRFQMFSFDFMSSPNMHHPWESKLHTSCGLWSNDFFKGFKCFLLILWASPNIHHQWKSKVLTLCGLWSKDFLEGFKYFLLIFRLSQYAPPMRTQITNLVWTMVKWFLRRFQMFSFNFMGFPNMYHRWESKLLTSCGLW